jgi:hypothetical protein
VEKRRAFHILSAPFRFLLIGIIFLYQKIVSPALPGSCIYTPTCSTYAIRSLKKHGLLKGFTLAITRIFRCAGGLYTGGEDPVPETFSFASIADRYRKFWRGGKKKDEEGGKDEKLPPGKAGPD